MSRRFWPCQAPGHAATAPSRMVSDGSGTSVSSVTWWILPRPWHSGHAPTAVFGENASESSRSVSRAGNVPARENSIRSRFDSVVTVPTDERDVAAPRRCCRATAGGSPVMSSTFGAPVWQQQPAGVGGDGLEVAALRLGVDRPEGQRRLARSGDAGEHDQCVARNGDVHPA